MFLSGQKCTGPQESLLKLATGFENQSWLPVPLVIVVSGRLSNWYIWLLWTEIYLYKLWFYDYRHKPFWHRKPRKNMLIISVNLVVSGIKISYYIMYYNWLPLWKFPHMPRVHTFIIAYSFIWSFFQCVKINLLCLWYNWCIKLGLPFSSLSVKLWLFSFSFKMGN